MAQAAETADTTSSTHPLIESNRVEGTPVYSPHGKHVGTIHHLIIEKVSGRAVYAVMSFGGFLGIGTHTHTIPWEKLKYDTQLGGFRTAITPEELTGAPVVAGRRRTGGTAGGSRTCMTIGRCRRTGAGQQRLVRPE